MTQPKDHDLPLPDWGPYSKRYAGVSHITNRQLGLRFDCSVFPALYRRRADIPNVNWESGWHPWECSPKFEYVSFRHELVWKDQIYADIAYIACPDVNGVMIRCEFVNETSRSVPVSLHTAASMQFPTANGTESAPLRKIHPRITNGDMIVIHPLDYEELEFASAEPSDFLVADGLFRGEIRADETLDGSALGGRFGQTPGDRVSYRIRLESPIADAVLVIRVMGQGSLAISGATTATISFSNPQVRNVAVDLGFLARGEHMLDIHVSAENLRLFALVIHSKGEAPINFEASDFDHSPEIQLLDGAGHFLRQGPKVVLKYPDTTAAYGIAWDASDYEVREILHDELDSFLRHHAHNHVDRVLRGNGRGHFTNVHVRPISLEAQSRTVIWGIVCSGEESQVHRILAEFIGDSAESRFMKRAEDYRTARAKAYGFVPNPAGGQFAFSQNRMAATTLNNIVFPVYAQRQYIRHRPPGRWWNSLYTWDSGFIGLGLLELSPDQAWQNLDQYLTAPGNPHAAFLHHGSMVPMQVHLYHELWNRTQDIDQLRAHYQSVRAMYLFHAGHSKGSTTRNLGSGLVRTWDYFYNSGGWDDYPPQSYVHRHGLQKSITPVINTAQVIRCAKSMLLAARALGEPGDIALYEADIAAFAQALEEHSWDETSGCYSYVVHDEAGNASHPLIHESGSNYNLGLDGLYPLIAGICPPDRAARLEEWIFDPKRLWTPVGVTAVDQSAPYFRADGYWSGTVWFSHQWFLWKTMLDLGRSEAAFRIATQALETWRAEVDDSYNCFEHFHMETGRGCGWHQFSGLSTPVMIFFSSCYCPGKISVGFDAWVVRSEFTDDHSSFDGEIHFPKDPKNPSARRAIWVCLRAGNPYHATWDGADIPFIELSSGLLAFELQTPEETSAPLQIRTLNTVNQP